jgi:hypothetical protein
VKATGGGQQDSGRNNNVKKHMLVEKYAGELLVRM